jgi:hypothetical protein
MRLWSLTVQTPVRVDNGIFLSRSQAEWGLNYREVVVMKDSRSRYEHFSQVSSSAKEAVRIVLVDKWNEPNVRDGLTRWAACRLYICSKLGQWPWYIPQSRQIIGYNEDRMSRNENIGTEDNGSNFEICSLWKSKSPQWVLRRPRYNRRYH